MNETELPQGEQLIQGNDDAYPIRVKDGKLVGTCNNLFDPVTQRGRVEQEDTTN